MPKIRTLNLVAFSTSCVESAIISRSWFHFHEHEIFTQIFSLMYLYFSETVFRWFIPVVCNYQYHKRHKVYKSNTTKLDRMCGLLLVCLFELGQVCLICYWGFCTLVVWPSLVFLQWFEGCRAMCFPRYWLVICVVFDLYTLHHFWYLSVRQV